MLGISVLGMPVIFEFDIKGVCGEELCVDGLTLGAYVGPCKVP